MARRRRKRFGGTPEEHLRVSREQISNSKRKINEALKDYAAGECAAALDGAAEALLEAGVAHSNGLAASKLQHELAQINQDRAWAAFRRIRSGCVKRSK